MNERSTHAVVGLWGNESTMTRGLGHDSSHALHEPVEEGVARVGRALVGDRRPSQGHLAHVGPGEERAPDVDRVRRRRHQRGVARADQHPHEMREALLGPDGRHHLGLGVELDAELALVEVGDGAAELGDAPARPSSGGCAGCSAASASLSTATSGEGRSGLPKPRSMTSRPARRDVAFRSLMVAKT